ncbi:ropporin-1-like protein [Cuculus canorus]|uniref:ropporin-1-like protein n=1 Tax=Cuculus canorus TaxID=55661 RepID=UPI0023AA6B03|nr:ropporin-1-like protein [Cuculus canorus]XP_053916803.1 ropporin-1-like protein [Cuculus canorus]XP_053916804.1 ropporin-1-like protein [Cuculus canorus]XP_053916805.1 ropporin-1-like protein [Cuculus canorus]XP_053916806.1 ropporin-1-like protein [Cuculus canorus]XP_053916807.1 ropporin-1-like protein [Cuculus canorus]
MPPPETIFCAQQIKIPPELPDILKQFTKAAIRTQPHDVLQWAAAYFSALSKGETLPVKERIEMPLAAEKMDAGLTPGLLKILHKQLSPKGTVTVAELKEKWKHLCLPEEQLDAILQLDNFGEEVKWMDILALGCSVLGKSILSSMKHACEILTEDPEGGAARIPFETFSYLYFYLASVDGDIPKEETETFLHKMKEQADKQAGMVLLRNFLPPLSTPF